jgi:hypothetical protein
MTGRARSADGLLDAPHGGLDNEWIDEELLDEVESILALKEFSSCRRRLKELEKDEHVSRGNQTNV